ncbi:MAG TPA: YfhO family protein, partial [Thermoanaerobaculia bacterium]|nr:YfhO family protein [Thermoanaerobaculia bacterium]
VSMLPSLVVLLIAALTPLLGRWRAAGVMLLLVVTIGELWRIDRTWMPVLPARLMYPKTPLIETLEALEKAQPKTNPIRIVGTGPVFFPNAPAVYGFEDVRAHDPMANGRYLGLLRVVTGYDPSDYFAKWVNLDTRMLDFLGVRYVVSSPRATVKDPQRFQLVYDGKDGRIFENRDVLPRFYPTPNVVLEFKREYFVRRMIRHEDWAHTAVLNRLPVENDQERLDLLAPRPHDAPQATLRVTSATPTDYRMRVHAPRYTLVVSSIPFWPGWKVTRNGKATEALQVNGGFLGYIVRPGDTEVRVHYAPLSFYATGAVSLLTMATLAALGVRSRMRRRRAAAAPG